MTAREFRLARREQGLTQEAVAKRLGVSQTYVALLEKGKRRFPDVLARKAVARLHMNPLALPFTENARNFSAKQVAQQLASLGYPGFRSMRAAWKRNPVQVLLDSLGQETLEARVAEALPWLLTNFGSMSEANLTWLVEQARLRNLTNRLGFVVTLAKEVLARKGETASDCYNCLSALETKLSESRLDKEDTLCQSLSAKEQQWLRENRPQTAEFWHLLTDWRPEHLQYAG
ncbi:MAG TPA: helix-turn-helix transcriptional regulator [Terriglobales bacterium]